MKINVNDTKLINIERIRKMINVLHGDSIDFEINYCSLSHKEVFHKKHLKSVYNPTSYRAVTIPSEKKIFIFENTGETEESILWLTIHELSHAAIRETPYLGKIFSIILKASIHKATKGNPNLYDTLIGDDNFHDSLLEEQLCNNLATCMIGKDYGRKWWRNQLKQVV